MGTSNFKHEKLLIISHKIPLEISNNVGENDYENLQCFGKVSCSIVMKKYVIDS